MFPHLWCRFSSFAKICRIVAYVRRFSDRLLSSRGGNQCEAQASSRSLSAPELASAELVIWKHVQAESFSNEIKALKKEQPIANSSRIASLLPLLSSGLLRAQGRVRKASFLPFEQKHPLILSVTHPAVKAFLRKVHVTDNFHEGIEYLRSVIQQKVWILGLRCELRRIKVKCVLCSKRQPKSLQPQMADLPVERLGFDKMPFAFSGIDFFGPFEIILCRSSHKRWGCLFTCLTTRAVHIEVCHGLSTDSSLLAIQRFIARQGVPSSFESDNGTNFVVSRELQELASLLKNDPSIHSYLAERSCHWEFNPPASPHFGGAWERLVRSCKKAMFAVLSSRRLTEETLSTTMCLVEQILNARPLTAFSSDPQDLEALTPNHFLLNRSTVFLPVGVNLPSDFSHRCVFKQAQSHVDWVRKR